MIAPASLKLHGLLLVPGGEARPLRGMIAPASLKRVVGSIGIWTITIPLRGMIAPASLKPTQLTAGLDGPSESHSGA